jgi:molybdopterin synthase catalytic subunit
VAANVHLTQEAIEPASLTAAVCSPLRGGVVNFLGTVRSHTGTAVTEALEYEAYEPMAEKVLAAIAAEVRARWPAEIRIVHRLGRLLAGEISVAVACPHRADAFAAAQYAIDELKRRAPIWKRDIAPAGTAWVENRP